MQCVGLDDVKQDLSEIKSDIKDIKQDLGEHMSRTAANEARLEMMEDFIKGQVEHNNNTMDRFITQNEKNAESQSKLIKRTLGLFAALAILIGALWQVNQ